MYERANVLVGGPPVETGLLGQRRREGAGSAPEGRISVGRCSGLLPLTGFRHNACTFAFLELSIGGLVTSLRLALPSLFYRACSPGLDQVDFRPFFAFNFHIPSLTAHRPLSHQYPTHPRQSLHAHAPSKLLCFPHN